MARCELFVIAIFTVFVTVALREGTYYITFFPKRCIGFGTVFVQMKNNSWLLSHKNCLASALHCWHCNNGQQPFCDDPFDEDKMSEPQKFGSYAECPGGVLDRSVCIKMVTFSKYLNFFLASPTFILRFVDFFRVTLNLLSDQSVFVACDARNR